VTAAPEEAGPVPARLSARTLAGLPASVVRPHYERGRLGSGVVHLGIGAFHRAHQAVYLDELIGRHRGAFGILGVSLRHANVRDALEPQDGLYTFLVRDGRHTTCRVIGSVLRVLVAPEDPETVLRNLTDPATRLVTLTVTEKGYCLAPGGRLDARHPEIARDLARPEAPRTAIGFLVEALSRIRAAGTSPPTLLSCDNLPSNGHLLRAALVDFAERRDAGLARWIDSTVATPSSMIDRIVPATVERDLAEVADTLGVVDRGAVVAEPFSQWVIEAHMSEGFPPLGEVGAEIVPDVAPYERMKLRLLNGCHSSIAYLGQLAGYDFVADALDDPRLRHFLERMMAEEIAPTLTEFSAERLADYSATLIRRFGNKAIRHRTWQISMDGSQKLPQRLIGTLADRARTGAPAERISLAIAAWFRFLAGTDDAGRPIEISDPRAAELVRLADPALPETVVVANMLERSGLFPPTLVRNTALRTMLSELLHLLRRHGAKEVLTMPALGGP
jgi:fructuronate reductase